MKPSFDIATEDIAQWSGAACPACRKMAHKIGEIPFSYHFLEEQLHDPLDTGNLYECSTCGLWFKHPYLSTDRIMELYRGASDHLAWHEKTVRPDFTQAKRILTKEFPDGGTVLDFGCYTGDFLATLPDCFQKCGVEPSPRAAAASSKRGIEILGDHFASLGEAQFSAVTLFDVFEHLTDPLSVLDHLFSHLCAGGLLLIVTGIADQWLFHAAGAKYNYVCLPEHVCFLTIKFASFLSERYGVNHQLTTLSRNQGGLKAALRAAAIDAVNLPMLLLRRKRAIARLYSAKRLQIISAKGYLPIGPAKDHALLVLRK